MSSPFSRVTSNGIPGAGGGAGGYIDAIITSPSATYSYVVGGGGSGGTVGYVGGAGKIYICNSYSAVIILKSASSYFFASHFGCFVYTL